MVQHCRQGLGRCLFQWLSRYQGLSYAATARPTRDCLWTNKGGAQARNSQVNSKRRRRLRWGSIRWSRIKMRGCAARDRRDPTPRPGIMEEASTLASIAGPGRGQHSQPDMGLCEAVKQARNQSTHLGAVDLFARVEASLRGPQRATPSSVTLPLTRPVLHDPGNNCQQRAWRWRPRARGVSRTHPRKMTPAPGLASARRSPASLKPPRANPARSAGQNASRERLHRLASRLTLVIAYRP